MNNALFGEIRKAILADPAGNFLCDTWGFVSTYSGELCCVPPCNVGGWALHLSGWHGSNDEKPAKIARHLLGIDIALGMMLFSSILPNAWAIAARFNPSHYRTEYVVCGINQYGTIATIKPACTTFFPSGEEMVQVLDTVVYHPDRLRDKAGRWIA